MLANHPFIPMKSASPSYCTSKLVSRIAFAALGFLPSLASAHPGHYHPGEEDEFDAISSGMLQSLTGADLLLLVLTICSVIIFYQQSIVPKKASVSI